ncbi:MAG: PEP-CTERM sorting domain-containing protein [Akkermansia sp.]
MKRTMMALLALAGFTFSSQATADNLDYTWLITFSNKAGTYDKPFLASGVDTNVKWNAVTTSASAIQNANGGASSISISSTDGATAGDNGLLQAKGTFDDKANQYFNTSSLSSSYVIRPFNAGNGTTIAQTLTLSGLSSGETYTMTVLFARGNKYAYSTEVQSITLTGADNVKALVLSQYGNTNATFEGSTLKSSEANGTLSLSTTSDTATKEGSNWILAQYSFTAGEAGTVTFAGKGLTIAGIALQAPEPTTATLSLLALAGLAARRRRR